MKDGKREREKQNVESVDDFANIVRFRSKIRPIITPVKAWCEKKGKMGKDYLDYGITFKLVKVEVEPAAGGNSNLSQYMNNDAFIDSDDEDESKFQGKPAVNNSKTSVLPLVNKNIKKESEDEEEEEEDPQVDESEEEEEEESEPEPEPEPVKPAKGKGAKAAPKKK
jgi:hypothetical protein